MARALSRPVLAERAAAVAYGRAQIAATEALIERGRVTAAEGSMLIRRMRAFVEALEQGLHRNG